MNTSVRFSSQKPARVATAAHLTVRTRACTHSGGRTAGVRAPAMSMADSSQMGSVKARSIFLKIKPMMASVNVRKPCPLPVTSAFAIM